MVSRWNNGVNEIAMFFSLGGGAAAPRRLTLGIMTTSLTDPCFSYRLFVTLGLWLALVLSAHGLSVEIPITTTNLDQYKYRFSIATNAAAGGVSFHIIVTAKKEDIPADSEASVAIVTHTKTRYGVASSMAGVRPAIPVRVKTDKRVWEASFTVSHELLEKPGLCFLFTELAHATIHGKTEVDCHADFYEIKLRDFLKQ